MRLRSLASAVAVVLGWCLGGYAAGTVDDPVVEPIATALPAPAGEPAGTAVITYTGLQQVVEGFGFSTAWGSLPGSDANDDAFFSVSKGAGFSILRNRIPFRERPNLDDKFMAKDANGAYTYTTVTDDQGTYKNFDLQWDNWDLVKTRDLLAKVKANGDYRLTKVFSTPWTPPNNAVDRWKLPTDAANKARNRLTAESYATKPDRGGYLDPAHYQDYADVLADYVLGFKANMGFDLYALSLQNEPNYDVDYESCEWTAGQLHDFLLVLKKEFTRKGVWKACPDLKIMAAEDNNFHDKLLSAVYADPATRDLVQIAAGHQYEYGRWSMQNSFANLFTDRDRYIPNTFDASFKLGKQVWMSEWSTHEFGATPPNTQALVLAKVIHQDFTRSHLNAFVFWWSASLLQNGKPTKDLWALGQYSRFARPGWRVLRATEVPASGVYVTAFANPATNKLAIVVVNANTAEKTITLNLAGAARMGMLSLYRTSASEDMVPVGSVKVKGAGQAVDLAASSISTFYGDVTP